MHASFRHGQDVPLKLPIQLVLAMKLLSLRDSTYEVGSTTASLLSIVHFSLVCRVSNCSKDRKGVQHVWKFETRFF